MLPNNNNKNVERCCCVFLVETTFDILYLYTLITWLRWTALITWLCWAAFTTWSLSRSKTLVCSLLLIYAKRLAIVLVEWVTVVNSQACIRWLWWKEVSYLQYERKMAHRNSKWFNRYTLVSYQIFIHRPNTSALFLDVFRRCFVTQTFWIIYMRKMFSKFNWINSTFNVVRGASTTKA